MSNEMTEKCGASKKCCAVGKKLLDALLDQPVLGSVFITDFVILSLHKPPFIFSLLMLIGLCAMSMYYGQKLGLFCISKTECTSGAEKTESAEETKQAD